ncbi:MAG: carboxypeptidase-like regulatory domain-containing protein, partial [Acidobacteriota bacterium]
FAPKSNGLKKCAVTFASNYDTPIKAALKGTGTGAATISGKVSTASGPLAGVTVTLGGAASLTAKTGTDGTYKFTPLADGAYTIKPTKRGYTFVPYKRAATVDVANVTGKDFTATPKTSATTGTNTSGGE